ncbi:hypothetical protein ASZ90_009067 [hydrocarbon metagenome]|uniref:Uncharacterized protein n=1 Tax=hydrocarbon metagenome TaxID=938273 RepID=A0A0W8FJV0_9ZZZZ
MTVARIRLIQDSGHCQDDLSAECAASGRIGDHPNSPNLNGGLCT